MKSIDEFCKTHDACAEGRGWALANCNDMQHVWDTARPDWLVWVATRAGVLTDNELRRFAVFCARSVEHLLTDERSRHAIDTAEKFLDGKASAEELAAASSAALAAWSAAATAATAPWSAAVRAAWSAWSAAATTGATTGAASAAWDAARASASAARASASAARASAARAYAAAAAWMRANTKPTF